MVFRGVHYLRKLLPEIERDIDGTPSQDDTLDQNAVLKLLVEYFNKKKIIYRFGIFEQTLKREAKYMHKLFPTFEREYIFEQLNLFKDMSDRIEIVLRILVNSLCKNTENSLVTTSHKRCSPNEYLDSPEDDNATPNKLRKVVIEKPQDHNLFIKLDDSCGLPAETVNNNNIEENSNPDYKFEQGSTDSNIEQSKKELFLNPDCSGTTEFQQFNDYSVYTHLDFLFGDAPIPSANVKPAVDYAKVSLLPNEFVENTEDLNKPPLPNFQVIEDKLRPVSEAYLNKTLNMYENMETAITSTIGVNRYHNFPIVQQRSGKPSTITSENNNSSETESFVNLVPDLNEPVLREAEPVVNTTPLILPKASVIVTAGPSSTVTEAQNIGFRIQDIIQEDKVFEPEHSAVPSTSDKIEMPHETNNDGNFDLVGHLREITSVPARFIRYECRKAGIRLNVQPPLPVMNQLIENLLENNLDESSTDSLTLVEEDVVHTVHDERTLPYPRKRLPPSPTTSNVDNAAAVEVVNAELPNQPSVPEPKVMKMNVDDPKIPDSVNTQLVNHLCGIFPEACPNYIRLLCRNRPMSNEVLDELITVILDTNNKYPRRPPPDAQPEVFPENQLEILEEFLPDADPDYLRMKFDSFEGKPEKVKAFINEAMELKSYPKRKDYLRRQQLSAQQKQYTTEFTVENFVKVIPDPAKFFLDPTREIKMDDASSHYALVFLRNTFNRLPVRTIQSVFGKTRGKLSMAVQTLHEISNVPSSAMKSKRKPMDMPQNLQNIPLLQEIAYCMHKAEITEYLEKKTQKEEAERREAISKGLIKTCGCCYDEEVLPKDIFRCENGCEFCKSCIVTATEVRFGEGKLDYPCLMNCESHFSLQTLQSVLSPKLFSKIAQKKTLEEVKAAGIEELEFCPFCDFATIPAEGYTVFSCLNPDCMKESCRSCKEPSHIPLRCDEIEKDEEVKARTYVENKMTEALLRKCFKCGLKFFKEEGCNKMTCSCGAQMCYVCGKPVTSYKHFNGNGGDRTDLCPLYSDANVLNKENVLKGAETAKAELGVDNLKHDPTADVQQYYKDRAKKNPQHQYLIPQQGHIPHHLHRLPEARRPR